MPTPSTPSSQISTCSVSFTVLTDGPVSSVSVVLGEGGDLRIAAEKPVFSKQFAPYRIPFPGPFWSPQLPGIASEVYSSVHGGSTPFLSHLC